MRGDVCVMDGDDGDLSHEGMGISSSGIIIGRSQLPKSKASKPSPARPR
jgi:hypothetical protein